MNAVLQSALVVALGSLLAPAGPEARGSTDAASVAGSDVERVFLQIDAADPSQLFMPRPDASAAQAGLFMAPTSAAPAELLPANDVGDFLPVASKSDAADNFMAPR